MNKKFCPNCGNELDNTVKFCAKCGYEFKDIKDKGQIIESKAMEPITQNPKKKGNTVLKVIGILVVAFVGLSILFAEDDTDTTVADNNYEQNSSSDDNSYLNEELDSNAEYGMTPTIDTALGLYSVLSENTEIPYTLNAKAEQFLADHDNLFPVQNVEDITDDLIDYQADYKQILKNDQKYGDKLVCLINVKVLQITESEIETGRYFTELNVIDENGQQYYIFYNGELSNVFEDNVISVIGLPLGNSYFTNLDGGETLVIAFAGSLVELIQ